MADDELCALLDQLRAALARGEYSPDDKAHICTTLQTLTTRAGVAEDAAELEKCKQYLFMGWWIHYCAENGFFVGGGADN